MHKFRMVILLKSFLCIAAMGLSGCLTFEKLEVRYDIEKDLTGKLKYTHHGVCSDAETLEEQREEMKEFYEKDYLELGEEMGRDLGIDAPKVTLLNKTDTKCDAVLSGEFTNIIRAFASFMESSDFEIKKVGDRFSVTLGIGEEQPEESKDNQLMTFTVRYAGKILENNAHKYDKDFHLMVWESAKIDKSGIHFVLEVEK